MSSLVRRIEIRIMKRGGFTRENWILDRYGKPVRVRRDGEITDPDDNPIGVYPVETCMLSRREGIAGR